MDEVHPKCKQSDFVVKLPLPHSASINIGGEIEFLFDAIEENHCPVDIALSGISRC